MKDNSVDPRYRALGMFAGAGVGLLSGAFASSLLLPAPTDVLAVASRYALAGLAPLTIGTTVIGLPAPRILRRRRTHPFVAAVTVGSLSLGVAFVIAAVAAILGTNFFLALVGFGVPVIWCMTVAVVLLPWLSQHRAACVVSLCGVGATSLVGLFTLG